jgi:lysine N6-hydroxylase
MNANKQVKLLGIGAGPFNLSLAVLMEKTKLSTLFLDQKSQFQWHSELMFADADMQTTYLKDLATPVDPTSPYTFLNYLNEKGAFYSFLNTDRKFITRAEFELYCRWACQKLEGKVLFQQPVQEVTFKNNSFVVKTHDSFYEAQHLSIATGLVPKIPEFTKKFIGDQVFHAKSPQLQKLNLTDKSVTIVGGGQTGLEIFRNCFKGKWGKPRKVSIMTGSRNFEPLDASPFTNEFFTPNYVNQFFGLKDENKKEILQKQVFASDGNTPHYLELVYNDLYQHHFVEKNPMEIKILPARKMTDMQKNDEAYTLKTFSTFSHQEENFNSDIVILCTGFEQKIPDALTPIKHLISFDEDHRFDINKSFQVKWDGPQDNHLYALNFSKHRHGIAEPQTSLMAWRAATVVNHLAGENIYLKTPLVQNFLQY